MQLIQDIKSAIATKVIMMALAGLALGQTGLYYVMVHPRTEYKQLLKQRMERMQEMHSQLTATDMSGLVDRLNGELEYIQEKHRKVFSHPLAIEQIPFFVSKLEQHSEAAGLQAVSKVGNTEQEKSRSTAVIDLTFSGTFDNVLAFLHRLDRWQHPLLIRDFSIEKRTLSGEVLSGSMRFLALIQSD